MKSQILFNITKHPGKHPAKLRQKITKEDCGPNKEDDRNKYFLMKIILPFLPDSQLWLINMMQMQPLKVVSSTYLIVCFVCVKERTCEKLKYCFYFTSKALSILEISSFKCSGILMS